MIIIIKKAYLIYTNKVYRVYSVAFDVNDMIASGSHDSTIKF